jgi:hypothetical protein
MLTALLFCVSFGKGAVAQATTPLVTASYAQGLTPPSGLGTVFQTALAMGTCLRWTMQTVASMSTRSMVAQS